MVDCGGISANSVYLTGKDGELKDRQVTLPLALRKDKGSQGDALHYRKNVYNCSSYDGKLYIF